MDWHQRPTRLQAGLCGSPLLSGIFTPIGHFNAIVWKTLAALVPHMQHGCQPASAIKIAAVIGLPLA